MMITMNKMMKTSVMFLATLLVACFTFYSCSEEDDKELPSSVEKAFYAKYPDATNVRWEKTKQYYEFEFYNGQYPSDAYFTYSGVWEYTETEIPYSVLPKAVSDAFQSSDWANWNYDAGDILQIDQAQGTLYLLDLYYGDEEIELLYSPDGKLKNAAEEINYPYWTW